MKKEGLINLKAAVKNEDWFKAIESDRLVGYNKNYNPDASELKSLYEIFNNDISSIEDELNKMCNNLVELGDINKENILSFNKIRNKYEVLEGDLFTRANNHRVLLLTAKAIKHKNKKFLEEITKSVEADLQLVLGKAKETLSQMSNKELEQFIQEERQSLTPKDIKYKSYLSDLEIYKSKMLRYTMQTEKVIEKKMGTFKDLFITDRFFVRNEWEHGHPVFKVKNVLGCNYDKSPDESCASKGDWFAYTDRVSVTSAIDALINKVSEKELMKILSETSSYQNGKNHLRDYVYDQAQRDMTLKLAQRESNEFNLDNTGLFETNARNNVFGQDYIKRTHLEFKAYKEVMFYTSKDDYGDNITIILDKKSNIIPDNASKIKYINEWQQTKYKYVWDGGEARITYIPRRYESTVYGNAGEVAVDRREQPFQPDSVSKPFSNFSLSYKGGIMNARNAKSFSLMQNGLPSYMQILIVKTLQNRELSKYSGFEKHVDTKQLPANLADKTSKNPVADSMYKNEVIARKTGTRYFTSGGSNGQPAAANQGAGINIQKVGDFNELLNMQNFIELLDRELGIAVGVNPNREGMTASNTNSTDNQQDLQQVTLRTIPYFYFHASIWNSVLNEHLLNYDIFFKKFFRENPDSKENLIEYITPDGTRELIKILPEHLNHDDIGLFVHDSFKDKQYIDLMTQKIAQNTIDPATADTMSTIFKAIVSGGSSEEIHRMIQTASDKQQARIQEQQESQMKIIQQQKEAEREIKKYESDLRIEESIIREREATKRTVAGASIDVQKFAIAADINKDGEADSVTKAKNDNESKEKIAKENNKTKIEVAKIAASAKPQNKS